MEETEEVRPHEEGEEEEEVRIDPNTLKSDLYLAASNNDTDKVLQLLDQRVPPTYVDARSGLTALHWAALNGNVPLVKRLLECGASEPYHQHLAKLKKDAMRKERKVKRHESNLSSILEQAADPEDPSEENKDERKNREEEDEEDEEDDYFDMGMSAVEVAVDYSKNTPLLWATHRGHLRVIWLLLANGYSPNDVDKMGNNALHLAAAFGDVKNLQVLIQAGGNAGAVNHYKNKPLDMAKNKPVRDLLAVAMEQGASLTLEDRARKHEQNLKQYNKMTESLQSAIDEAKASMEEPVQGTDKRINRLLMDAIQMGEEFALDQTLISQAELLLRKLEVTQDLEADIAALKAQSPIRTQTDYLEHVYQLEKSIERAAEIGVDEQRLQSGLQLIARCQIEYWLSTLLDRLKDVVTAVDANEHDMNKLRSAIDKAEELQADSKLIDTGRTFLRRLDAELGMSRALKNIPTIRVPMENAPEGYYTEKDTGCIQETEGYPLPPADTGEYVWLPAESLTAFTSAISNLRSCYTGADVLGANPTIIAESKERLAKAEKEIKLLESKDAADKQAALEAVKKLAKKLKKKKKAEKK